MLVLVVGGSNDWKLPIALAAAAFISAYVVREQVMFRQAPITAAIIIASSLEKHTKLSGVELGARRVAEVLLGCVVGVAVGWLMSKLWPISDKPLGAHDHLKSMCFGWGLLRIAKVRRAKDTLELSLALIRHTSSSMGRYYQFSVKRRVGRIYRRRITLDKSAYNHLSQGETVAVRV
jgi:hypothetical protein